MNACLWCDAPCEGKLCPQCNTCPHCTTPIAEHPLYRCTADARHTVPILGHSCAECDYIAQARARRAAVNAPIIVSLERIRARHIAEWSKPWPGLEFGKAHFGMMLDQAIAELKGEQS